MDNKQLPFNISIFKLTTDQLNRMTPVTAMDIMDGKTHNFNANGLFSTEIFGKVGDEKRNTTFSYISLNTKLLHPLIYRTICEVKPLYKDIIASKQYCVWDSTINDFTKSNPTEGSTGYQLFMSYIDKINWDREGSELIQRKIKVIKESIKSEKCFIEYLLVMPAGLRDYEIDKRGKPTENEINTFYRKLLGTAHLITKADPYSPMLDITRFRMQTALAGLYEYIENLLKGKRKLILGKWASRQIFNGTRNVITSLINNTDELYGPKQVDINSTVVGLYQFVKSTIPLAMYYIRNGFLLNVFPSASSPMFMTNKKTLKKEMVHHNSILYDQFMTNEGLEKTITKFGDESIRDMILETDTHYLYLIYRDKDHYLLLQDIDSLPKSLDKNNVSPITFGELIYLNVYNYAKNIPAFVTRYPILGTGGIYPSISYVKTTIKSTIKKELDSFGNETNKIANEFPERGSQWVDSVSPNISHIKSLGADFDGDTISFNSVYSEQAINEVKNYINSKRYYLSSAGGLTYSMSTDTTEFIFANLTG